MLTNILQTGVPIAVLITAVFVAVVYAVRVSKWIASLEERQKTVENWMHTRPVHCPVDGQVMEDIERRIATLERDERKLHTRLARMENSIEHTKEKVDALYDFFLQRGLEGE